MDNYIAVVGGVNVDVGGRSLSPLLVGDSNPGEIRTTLGGVGRNIAHNLALLGANVRLITALGDDDNAVRVEKSCRELGIDLSDAIRVPDAATSTYLFICGPDGDMVLALNDMSIYAHLTPEVLAPKLPVLNAAKLVLLDANIPQETIEFIAHRCTAPIFVDPVSASKVGKCASSLGYFHTIKPNRLEAELLSNIAITDDESLARAADVLLATGLKRVIISLGGDGVYAASGSERLKLPALPTRTINTTGCGDAFMAAITLASLEGHSLTETAMFGLVAGALCAESRATINPELSLELLKAKLEELRK